MSYTDQKPVDVVAIITRLAELCPKVIFVYEGRRRPLAIGIRDQIAGRVAGSIMPDELNLALRAYTSNSGYLRAMARPGAQRIDCEGNEVGAVSPEHAAGAAKALAARLARREERRKAEAARSAGPVHSSPAPMSSQPRRLTLADLRASALARKAVAS